MAREWTDTNGQFIDVGSVAGPSAAFTFGIWARPDVVNQTLYVASMYTNGGNAYFQFAIRNDGNLGARIHQVRDVDFIGRRTAGSQVATGTWQHLLFTWNGGTANDDIDIFIDGVELDSANDGGGTFTAANSGSSQYFIGNLKLATPSVPFDGRLAEACSWSVVLTQGEIDSLAGGVSPIRIRPQSIFHGYWPIFGVDSPEGDYSGNQNAGTINGTLVIAAHAPVQPQFAFDTGWEGLVAGAAPAAAEIAAYTRQYGSLQPFVEYGASQTKLTIG